MPYLFSKTSAGPPDPQSPNLDPPNPPQQQKRSNKKKLPKTLKSSRIPWSKLYSPQSKRYFPQSKHFFPKNKRYLPKSKREVFLGLEEFEVLEII